MANPVEDDLKISEDLKQYLRDQNLEYVYVNPDGDCFFRSIAEYYQRTGEEIDVNVTNVTELRHYIIGILRSLIDGNDEESTHLRAKILEGVNNKNSEERLIQIFKTLSDPYLYDVDAFDIMVEITPRILNVNLRLIAKGPYGISDRIIKAPINNASTIILCLYKSHFGLLYPEGGPDRRTNQQKLAYQGRINVYKAEQQRKEANSLNNFFRNEQRRKERQTRKNNKKTQKLLERLQNGSNVLDVSSNSNSNSNSNNDENLNPKASERQRLSLRDSNNVKVNSALVARSKSGLHFNSNLNKAMAASLASSKSASASHKSLKNNNRALVASEINSASVSRNHSKFNRANNSPSASASAASHNNNSKINRANNSRSASAASYNNHSASASASEPFHNNRANNSPSASASASAASHHSESSNEIESYYRQIDEINHSIATLEEMRIGATEKRIAKLNNAIALQIISRQAFIELINQLS